VVLVVVGLLAGPLAAQSPGGDGEAPDAATSSPPLSASAQTLFDAAKALAQQKRWLEACPKFQASFDLDPQVGVLIALAHCWENAEKLATAWARWQEAAAFARRKGDDRAAYCEGRRDALAPKLPKVVVAVRGRAPDLRIELGKSPLPVASYGLPLPMDPGPVDLVVRRAGKVLERRRAEARAAVVTTIDIDLAAIARAHPASRSDKPRPPPKPYDATQRNAAIVVGAVGLAASVTAGALLIAALVKKGQADEADGCVNNYCGPQGLEAAEDAATFAEVGQWLGIAGLATLAVGVTLYLTAPAEDDGRAARVHLRLGSGVAVGASF
jgi:hypothetical protein